MVVKLEKRFRKANVSRVRLDEKDAELEEHENPANVKMNKKSYKSCFLSFF